MFVGRLKTIRIYHKKIKQKTQLSRPLKPIAIAKPETVSFFYLNYYQVNNCGYYFTL